MWRISLDVSRPEMDAFEAVLTPEERRRADRFATDELRSRWIVGRGALRMILGEYIDVPALQVAFTGGTGKPRLAGNASPVFNLTHTGGTAFVAVALHGLLGIDAETERPDVDWLGISRRFFSLIEANEIAALPPEQRPRAGYACWTRKEAYAKALGVGLLASFGAFQVSLLPNDRPRLIRVFDENDTPEQWTLVDLSETGLSVCVAFRGPRADIERFTLGNVPIPMLQISCWSGIGPTGSVER